MTSEALLDIVALDVKLGTTQALRGATLAVGAGERVAIVGPSGAGKSTLLYAAVGLLKPHAGVVRYRGQALAAMPDRELSAWRRKHVGFVFQFGHLIQEMTVVENIAMPLLVNGSLRKHAQHRAEELLREFRLRHIATRFPDQISGGELQRVAVARAAAHRPQLIVADEPTGALDSKAGNDVLDLLYRVTGPAANAALLIVTHDPDVARRADRIIHVRDGRTALPEEIHS